LMAYDAGELDIHAEITVRIPGFVPPLGEEASAEEGETSIVTTTLGRTLFNEALPIDYPYINKPVDKKVLSGIVNDLAERYPKVAVAASLYALMVAGFSWATRSGVTIAISDIIRPEDKPAILEEYEERANKVQSQYDLGLITDIERRTELIEIWTEATNKVDDAMQKNFPVENAINQMVSSGARGNWTQVRQIAGMRGLVANPQGRSFLARSSPTTVKACRSSSTSSRPTVRGRDLRIPRCAPPTPGTSPGAWSTSRRTSSSAKRTAVLSAGSRCPSPTRARTAR